MAVKRRSMIAITILCFIMLVVLLAWCIHVVSEPVTGEWHPKNQLVNSGIQIELRRIAILPWSSRNPQVFERISLPEDPPEPHEYYLHVRMAIYIDGVPIQEVKKGVVESLGPLIVTYDGRRLIAGGRRGVYPGAEKSVYDYIWFEVSPWNRGLDREDILVHHRVTMKSQNSLDFVFRVQVE